MFFFLLVFHPFVEKMLLALHFASVLVVSASFQLLYTLLCCCPQLSFCLLVSCLDSRDTDELSVSFFVFQLRLCFFDVTSSVAIDGDCFSADRFHTYCRFCCLFFLSALHSSLLVLWLGR